MTKFEMFVDTLKTKSKPNEIKSTLTAKFGEEFAEMNDYSLTHTINVVKNLKNNNINDDNLLVAAFFRNFGKALVCAPEYEDKSAEPAARILPQTGLTDEKQTEEILFYISNYDAFLNIDGTEESVIEFIEKETGTRCTNENSFFPDEKAYRKLVSLCEADITEIKKEKEGKGEAADSEVKKLEKLKTVRDIIKRNDVRINNLIPKAGRNRSFICIPFRFKAADNTAERKNTETKLLQILNDSDLMDNMNESKNKILSYVAGRFNCEVKQPSDEGLFSNSTVCIARKIKEDCIKKDIPGDYSFELEECKGLSFSIENLYLFCFKKGIDDTGVNILVEEIEFSENDYEKISDNLFFLKDSGTGENKKGVFSNKIIYRKQENESVKEESRRDFHSSLIENIFKDLEFSIININSGSENAQYVNIISYFSCTEAYYKLHEPDLLFRLSHCYKKDIEFRNDTDDIFEKYTNNNNGIWGITSYSNACIAFANDHEEDFFEMFTRGYLLLYMSLLNQKYTLYGFLDRIPRDLSSSNAAKEIREQLYRFEMDCNFKTVSELPQYQNVYSKTYDVFNIRKLVSDVQEPLEAYDSILAEKERQEEEERDKKRDSSLAIISVLAISSAVVDLWDIIGKYFDEMYESVPVNCLKKFLQLVLCSLAFFIWLKCISPLLKELNDKLKNAIKNRKKKKGNKSETSDKGD